MINTKPSKTDWREKRRFQALQLKKKGWKQAKIAEALGVSEGAVSQWFTKVERGGEEALHTQPKCGAPPKLAPEQLQQLAQLLLVGPQTYGFEAELWTSKRVKWLIEFRFGVKLHRAHVSRLLREQLNWSVQKPVEKASQRDEEAIAKFKEERWPQLKKRLKTRSAPLSG
jgi:transposase